MNIGFVSTRFAGLDGVTLEAAKLAEVARQAGHEVVWFAGELGPEFSPGRLVPDAHFDSDANRALQARCFGVEDSSFEVRQTLHDRAAAVEDELRGFVDYYDVDVLVPQNSSTIPMQLPLGVATASLLSQTGMRAVAHHHDFAWERERFSPTGVADVLKRAFPPNAPGIRHMVINSLAQDELLARRGIRSAVLPNVMDFERPPAPGNPGAFRTYAGLDADDLLLLQPTRIIPRKAIEDAIILADRLGPPAKVVITHPEHDEGDTYSGLLEQVAAEHRVDLRFCPVGEPGTPSLADAYAAADLVTYPSRIEGFGNALLEACFYRRPLLVNRYPVYVADIAPSGLRVIEMDGAITDAVVAEVQQWLGDPRAVEDAVAHNYQVCVEHFSYRRVREVFLPLLAR